MGPAIKRLLESAKVGLGQRAANIEIEDRDYYLCANMDFDEGSKYFLFARKTSQKVSKETLQELPLSNESVELIKMHLIAAMQEYKENQPIEDEDENLQVFDGFEEHGVSNEMFINL